MIYSHNHSIWIQDLAFGRRDSTTASNVTASTYLPPPDTGFNSFVQIFMSKGMSLKESVAILGTIYIHQSGLVFIKRNCFLKKILNLPILLHTLKGKWLIVQGGYFSKGKDAFCLYIHTWCHSFDKASALSLEGSFKAFPPCFSLL